MRVAGLIAYLPEENKFPIAPAILGAVLDGMLEENFITSMIKPDGNLLAFFSRPIAATLAVVTILVWITPPLPKMGRNWLHGGYMSGNLATWWLHENGVERWQDPRKQTRQTLAKRKT